METIPRAESRSQERGIYMKKVFIVIAVFLFYLSACGTGKDTEPTEEIASMEIQEVAGQKLKPHKTDDVEINIISLEICPELSKARMTYDMKLLKEVEQPDSVVREYYECLIIGSDKVEEMQDGSYRVVETGDYTVSEEELEKSAGVFRSMKWKAEDVLDSSQIKKDEMEITRIPMQEFEATDGNGISMFVKLCPFGGRIDSEQDWQQNKRIAYVIADLQDGSSEYVAKLPCLVTGKDRKKYQVEPPEEVLDLQEKEYEDCVIYIPSGVMPDFQTYDFYTDEDINLEVIKSFRLIIQELE